jgi:hypothetical protein
VAFLYSYFFLIRSIEIVLFILFKNSIIQSPFYSMAELANGGVQEEVSDAPEGEEQEAILIKKRVKLESNFGEL